MQSQDTIERNKASIRHLFDEVINAHRLDLCDRYLAADRVDHQDYGLPPGAADGHNGFRTVLGPFCEAFPDLRLDIEFMTADDDRIVVYNATTGTHIGSFMGMPASGKKFKATGADIFRFDGDGKIAEHWGVFDTFGMLSQLGLLQLSGHSDEGLDKLDHAMVGA